MIDCRNKLMDYVQRVDTIIMWMKLRIITCLAKVTRAPQINQLESIQSIILSLDMEYLK
jgi:hypothetical protein